jgi:hypothetical protein
MKGSAMTEPTNSFTVFRRQVIQTGSYEPSEASCSVTITVDPTLTKEELGVEIAEWGATCDIANYEALGLAYEVTEQGVRMLQKSVPRVDTPNPVAAPAPAPAPARAAGTFSGPKAELWADLMNNNGDWWPPNWEKKLDGSFTKLTGPDYKHKKDDKSALWLTTPQGDNLVPVGFVCPFSQKNADDLGKVGKQIRARM